MVITRLTLSVQKFVKNFGSSSKAYWFAFLIEEHNLFAFADIPHYWQ